MFVAEMEFFYVSYECELLGNELLLGLFFFFYNITRCYVVIDTNKYNKDENAFM